MLFHMIFYNILYFCTKYNKPLDFISIGQFILRNEYIYAMYAAVTDAYIK